MNSHSDQKTYELYKPPIFSQIHSDESPMAYLVRLSKLNSYSMPSWLIKGRASATSFELTYMLVRENEWTGYAQLLPEVEELSLFFPYERITKWLFYCPVCLSEQNYVRYSWQIKASTVCLKHRIWLHDRCPVCQRYITHVDILSGRCNCGAELSQAVIEKAPVNRPEYLGDIFI